MRTGRFFWWAIGAALSYPPIALAGAPTRLIYIRDRATSSCPEQAVLEAAVSARLGYEPFAPWGDQTIVATISRRDERLVARAELVDHDGIVQGHREVTAAASHCDELVETLALAISITLDPMRVPAEQPPQTGAAANEARAPALEPRTDAAQEPARDADELPSEPRSVAESNGKPRSPAKSEGRAGERGLGWSIQAGVLGLAANVPHPVLGGRAALGAEAGEFSIWLEGQASLPAAESAAEGGEVRVSLRSAALAPCLRVWGPISTCVVGSLGSFRATGSGVSVARTESVLYAAAGARGLLTVPFGKTFSLLGQGDLAAVLTRPTFQLRYADVWRPGPVSLALGAGVGARFF